MNDRHEIDGLMVSVNHRLEQVEVAQKIFHSAVEQVSAPPLRRVASELSLTGTNHVVGAGKAAMAMAAALEREFPNYTFEGQVVVPHGYIISFPEDQTPPATIEVIEGGHPVPDENSRRAATEALKIAKACKEGDTLIVLLSGGASALWSLPADGVTLEDLRTINRQLLQSGHEIHQTNTVRKHLSAIKGGQLAIAAWPASTVTFAISDVIGNDPSAIGSGPTVADPTHWSEAMEILMGMDLSISPAIVDHVNRGVHGHLPDTPKPGSKKLEQSHYHLLASNMDALKAAVKKAEALGFQIAEIHHSISGEAREVGKMMAKKTKNLNPGECILWGGETTVTVNGTGKGGRNQELVLAAARELARSPVDLLVLSGGTDGIDGPTDAAGGWVTSATVEKARSMGIDPDKALQENDAYTFLHAMDQLLITHPTHTNVMDIGIGLRAHE